MSAFVTVHEVGPRDGLQNEKEIIATADKIALIDRLSCTGLRRIEATSFVSPRWVPQMADAEQVLRGVTRHAGVRYGALTPNLQGFERALAARADEVAVFASASETFSLRNINCTVAQSLERFEAVMAAARAAGLPVRGYVSCACACPYEGAVAPDAVAQLAARLLAMGCYEISLGDTIGAGTPETVGRMLRAVLERVPAGKIAGHFHDTGNRALANVEAALALGVRVFDAAVGGLGGCPYAPGAKGNVATAALVERVESLGFETGIDREALQAAQALLAGRIARLA